MENVRMGEMVVSARPGDELSAIGLGSCIGLAVADRQSGVVGLAHVVLPESFGVNGPPGKFADLAVPELLHRLEAAGAVRRRLLAVIMGGARMFAGELTNDIGARNTEAVRECLDTERVAIHAQDIGGDRGRTARIIIGHSISVQLAGGDRTALLDLRQPEGVSSSTLGVPGLAEATT